MERRLGYLSDYGIEYIFEFLGQERINKKISELKDTATMGTSFEEIMNGSFISGTGPLFIYTMMVQWFKDDIQFLLFLFERSKLYNEANYLKGGNLESKWRNYEESLDRIAKTDPANKAYLEHKKKNPFWIEFHFFYLILLKELRKFYGKREILETDFRGNYDLQKKRLIGPVELEIKTRKKPGEGQYLSFKKMDTWFNLELINENESEAQFKFMKNGGSYKLSLDKINNKALIELIEVDLLEEEKNDILRNIDLKSKMPDIIDSYMPHLSEIAQRQKEQNMAEGGKIPVNGCISEIAFYYEKLGNIDAANEVIDKSNSYVESWRSLDKT